MVLLWSIVTTARYWAMAPVRSPVFSAIFTQKEPFRGVLRMRGQDRRQALSRRIHAALDHVQPRQSHVRYRGFRVGFLGGFERRPRFDGLAESHQPAAPQEMHPRGARAV